MDFTGYDYVIDAIDMVKAKVEIISRAKAPAYLSSHLWEQAIR